jgi:hypothetical protein
LSALLQGYGAVDDSSMVRQYFAEPITRCRDNPLMETQLATALPNPDPTPTKNKKAKDITPISDSALLDC